IMELEFADCMTKCVGESIDNIERWLKKAKSATECVTKCVVDTIKQTALMRVTSEYIKSNDFVQCLKDCALQKANPLWIVWGIVLCNIHWQCWLLRIGIIATKCLFECVQ
ncbi:unnamed protein product, partial [Owenia fusiformis]